MPDRKREAFAADELAIVLSHYGLGRLESVTEFTRGSRKSPKVGIVCERGKFLLKRRSRGRANPKRVRFAHDLQAHLATKGFPLPKLVPPDGEPIAALQYAEHVYELFEYARGQHYGGTVEETRHAGAILGQFHNAVRDFHHDDAPTRGDYHDTVAVRTGLSSIGSNISSHDSAVGQESELLSMSQELYDAYEQCSELAITHGVRSGPTTIIHGDWHPGNMLFRNGEIVAVIDYDAARPSQRVIDIANGTLQFSFQGVKEIEDWPDEIDETRAAAFLQGVTSELQPEAEELACLPYLMTEALISEAVLPIAATGSFGHYQGFRFMKMVRRKARWLVDNADRLAGDFVSTCAASTR